MDWEVYFKTDLFEGPSVQHRLRGEEELLCEEMSVEFPATYINSFPTHWVPTCSSRPIIQNNNKKYQQFAINSTDGPRIDISTSSSSISLTVHIRQHPIMPNSRPEGEGDPSLRGSPHCVFRL